MIEPRNYVKVSIQVDSDFDGLQEYHVVIDLDQMSEELRNKEGFEFFGIPSGPSINRVIGWRVKLTPEFVEGHKSGTSGLDVSY